MTHFCFFNCTQSCTFTHSSKTSLYVKLQARGLCNGGFVAGLLNRRSALPSLPSSLHLSLYLSASPPSPPLFITVADGCRWIPHNHVRTAPPIPIHLFKHISSDGELHKDKGGRQTTKAQRLSLQTSVLSPEHHLIICAPVIAPHPLCNQLYPIFPLCLSLFHFLFMIFLTVNRLHPLLLSVLIRHKSF